MPDRGPGTGTNYKKRKWNTTFRSEIPAGKTGPPFFLGIFLWDEPTKRVPSTAEPEIPEILTKWKAPNIWYHSVTLIKRLAPVTSLSVKL